jgi:hypothetical protein
VQASDHSGEHSLTERRYAQSKGEEKSKSKEISCSKTCYVVISQDDERQDDAAEFKI